LDFLSILPPVIAIACAIFTRKVILSLILGIFAGSLILELGNPFFAFFQSNEIIVEVFKSEGNVRTILFSLLIGAIIVLIKVSGGVSSFVHLLMTKLYINNSKKSQLLAACSGIILFIESNISIITSATIVKPLFQKFKISKEKLAYIVDSTCAPIAVLLPFNAWGAMLVTQIEINGVEEPSRMFISAIPFFIYPIVALMIVFIVILFDINIGAMKKDVTYYVEVKDVEEKEGKVLYFIIPVFTLIIGMIAFMFITGNGSITQGSGSKSVLYSVTLSLMISLVYFKIEKIFSYPDFMKYSFQGMHKLLEVVTILILSFAINIVCAKLGTGKYIASVISDTIPIGLVPVLIFIISSFIAFSTGTSWGTFAIMMSIGIPVAIELQCSIPLIIGAVISGGIWGDHCSPISDTTVISSLAAECDHVDHVKTQLPYALIGGFISITVFLIVGFIS
jgi:tetracycline resistance efflux pump